MYCIDDDGARQRGAVGSRRQACLYGQAQGGGTVWLRGDVDGRPGNISALIPVLKMGRRKMVAVDSQACTCGAC